MTVKEYISGKFQSFGIQVSEADFLDMSLNANKEMEEEVRQECIGSVSVAMALLLRATSISESGFSMSWNIDGIKDYYSLLCRQYGLKDELNDNKPKIRFL